MSHLTTKDHVERAIGGELDDRSNPVVFQTRMHVVGAELLEKVDGERQLRVWCDCGWSNYPASLEIAADIEIGDIPFETICEAVQPWREHLHISMRLFHAHSFMAKKEKMAKRAALAAAKEASS